MHSIFFLLAKCAPLFEDKNLASKRQKKEQVTEWVDFNFQRGWRISSGEYDLVYSTAGGTGTENICVW